jgi:hypothetical protein
MTDPIGSRVDLLAVLLRELSHHGMEGELPVRGGSMRPTLREGDRVRLVPATASDVRVGDVVVRAGASGPIIHRLVGWWPSEGGSCILTKGDGAARLDPPGGRAEVVGRVVARVRDGRVRRLDRGGTRLCGRGRAAASLAEGLILELWSRGSRLAGSRRA